MQGELLEQALEGFPLGGTETGEFLDQRGKHGRQQRAYEVAAFRGDLQHHLAAVMHRVRAGDEAALGQQVGDPRHVGGLLLRQGAQLAGRGTAVHRRIQHHERAEIAVIHVEGLEACLNLAIQGIPRQQEQADEQDFAFGHAWDIPGDPVDPLVKGVNAWLQTRHYAG